MSASDHKRGPRGRYVVTSLGCKVNQAEAAWLAAELAASGWREAGAKETAEAAVLLTCSVTGAAARQSRQMARRLARAHGTRAVVVTGCDFQAAAADYHKLGFGGLARADLARLPTLLVAGQMPPSALPAGAPDVGPLCPGLRVPGRSRTRALLKVQDGCDQGCAYCIVPFTRGRPRSLPFGEAAAAFAALGAAGAAEVVLCGIHLGQWGRDLPGRPQLPDLLRTLLAAHQGPRIRLSSLEATELSHELLGLMASQKRICPHLHLPLQSGCDRVLGAMGRTGGAAVYARWVKQAAAALPGLCLGADVLVGLPGEDRAAFAETRALLESLPLSYLHVFSYSPRPGTRAAAMKGRPPAAEVSRRSALLRRLAGEKKLAFLSSQEDRLLQVVVERSGMGRSQNYCLVALDQKSPPGRLLEVKAERVGQGPGGPVLKSRAV